MPVQRMLYVATSPLLLRNDSQRSLALLNDSERTICSPVSPHPFDDDIAIGDCTDYLKAPVAQRPFSHCSRKRKWRSSTDE